MKDRAGARGDLKAGTIFVFLNLSGGFLHYLYQAIASRELPLSEFSSLNAWYAGLATLMALPQFLQYAANFMPLPAKPLRLAIISLNVIAAVLSLLWFAERPSLDLFPLILILVITAVFSWLCGQAQSRLMLGTMGIAGVLVGTFKLLALLWPHMPRQEVYLAAIFLSYLPAIWFLSWKLWKDQHPHPQFNMSWQKWVAPILLSVSAALFPQMDLLILHGTQSPDVYGKFALSSLFYKALYFIAFAYMQWLLPHQIRTPSKSIHWRPLAICAGLGLTLSALATATGPILGQMLLRWPESPSSAVIFLSCLNTCLLTWIYVQIQSECTRGRLNLAALALAGVALEMVAQIFLRLEIIAYLGLAIAAQASILVTMYFLDSTAQIHSRMVKAKSR